MLQTRFFTDFCTVLIDDFRRFARISAFLHVFAYAFERFQDAIGFKTRSFSWISHRSDLKIHEISALGAKYYLNVVRSAPDMKIALFCIVLPGRAPNTIFHRLL